MASAPALAPIKALDRLFLTMGVGEMFHEMYQNTNVLQIWLKTSQMSENRQSASPFHNKWSQNHSSFSS
jgi:hypothetical protein